jgi:hypothetical protein
VKGLRNSWKGQDGDEDNVTISKPRRLKGALQAKEQGRFRHEVSGRGKEYRKDRSNTPWEGKGGKG